MRKYNSFKTKYLNGKGQPFNKLQRCKRKLLEYLNRLRVRYLKAFQKLNLLKIYTKLRNTRSTKFLNKKRSNLKKILRIEFKIMIATLFKDQSMFII